MTFDIPMEVTCPECHTEFPITQQDEWSGLCPNCRFEATENYISALRRPKLDETEE